MTSSSTLPRVGVWTLAREEIRALPRNLFGLSAVALVLGLFAPVAAFAYTGEGGVDETLLFTWLIAELVVAIVVAARVAAARRSRFVDSLYTTPLEQRTWLAAQVIVGAALALLVILVQVPFLLVYILFLGVPAALPPVLLAAVGMGAFAVAFGLFCGVAVGDAGPGAASGIAGGVAFLSFVLLLLHGLAVTAPPTPGQVVMLRLTGLSPLTMVVEGAGIDIFGMTPQDAWRPVLGLVALTAGFAGAAWWSYTRAQAPLGWDARGGRSARGVVVALVALALLVPVTSAEVDFHEAEGDGVPFYSGGEHTQIALVARGAPIEEHSFTLMEIIEAPDLPLGRDVELDALVLLTVPDGTSIRGVRITVSGGEGVRVVEGGVLQVPDGRPETRAPQAEGWDSISDGPAKPVYRVPVTLRATSVEALADSPSLVEVRTEFLADGRALSSVGRMHLDGEIPGAQAMVAAAGAPIPLLALGAVITRKLRTR